MKFYALSPRAVHYGADPPIHCLALVKRNVHVARGACHSAVQCDLLVARHHELLREIIGRQRHHVAESALNAIAVVQEELRLFAQNVRQAKQKQRTHLEGKIGCGVSDGVCAALSIHTIMS